MLIRSDPTGAFGAKTGPLPSRALSYVAMVSATDGYRGPFAGTTVVQTAYGWASYGIQVRSPQGRFGWYNLDGEVPRRRRSARAASAALYGPAQSTRSGLITSGW